MIDVYLDPATLIQARLASGRTIVQADGFDHRVIAVVETLPSGRPLLSHVRVLWSGRALERGTVYSRVFEDARRELLGVLGCSDVDAR